jgi:hypothetical protein
MHAGTPAKRELDADNADSDRPMPVALDRQSLIDGLNHDLAGEYETRHKEEIERILAGWDER